MAKTKDLYIAAVITLKEPTAHGIWVHGSIQEYTALVMRLARKEILKTVWPMSDRSGRDASNAPYWMYQNARVNNDIGESKNVHVSCADFYKLLGQVESRRCEGERGHG